MNEMTATIIINEPYPRIWKIKVVEASHMNHFATAIEGLEGVAYKEQLGSSGGDLLRPE